MALTFAVENVFKAKEDDVTQAFRKMARGADNFEKASVAAFKKSSKQASQFGTIVKGILTAGVIQKGFGLMAQGIQSAGQQFLDFDQAAIGAAVRFKDVGAGAENFNEKLREIKKTAREAGQMTEYTAAQNAAALDFLARAGWKSAEAFGGLKSMVDLATSTGEEFGRVADISSDLLGSFSMNSDITAKKIENLNRLNDALVVTTSATNTTVETLFETMKQVGPVATKIFSENVEDVTAMAGVLGNNAIKGTEAMTVMKNAYLRLAAPAKEAAGIMKQLNFSLEDKKTGQARKMVDVLEDLRGKLAKFKPVKQAEMLDTLFGKYAIAGVKVLMEETDAVRELADRTRELGGANAKTAEIMRTSLINRLKSLGSAATELGFQIFDAFDERGANAVDKFTQYLRSINLKPALDQINSFLDKMSELKQKQEDIAKTDWRAVYDKWEAETFKSITDSTLFKKGIKGTEVGKYMEERGSAFLIMKDIFSKMFKDVPEQVRQAQEFKRQQAGKEIDYNQIAPSVIDDYYSRAYLNDKIAVGQDYNREQIQRPQTQRIDIGGTLNIAGAPEGSTYKPSSSAPPIDTRFTAPATGL